MGIVLDSVESLPVDRLAARAGAPRPPGTRALRTRSRLLSCTRELIDEVSYRDLTSALVTQRLGLSPSAFYRYFGGINDAILELTAAMRETADGIATLVAEGDWDDDEAAGTARAVIDAMAGFWTEHRALYRVTDLCADEGDERFGAVKADTFAGLTASIEKVIARYKRAGRHPRRLDPYAAACVIVTMLIHTMAREPAYDAAGVAPASLRMHVARLLRTGITGEIPSTR